MASRLERRCDQPPITKPTNFPNFNRCQTKMSEHGTPAVKPADDPAFQLPASLAKLSLPMCIAGVVALVAGYFIGNGVSQKFAMSAYLTAFMYCLTVTIGCLFFVLVQHLCRAGWSIVVRRIAELVMIMIVPLAILFLPILLSLSGEGVLYGWDHPQYGEIFHLNDTIWDTKTGWLTQGWFTFRSCVYFAVWSLIAVYFYRGSVAQDETGEKAVTDRMQWWSGPCVVLFSLTTTLAAFDWIMSLAPMWFSTMFGVYLFAGSFLSAHCAITVGAYLLQRGGAMRDEVTVEHYHDLGKLIFGFIFFWTYIGFSQFMLIWYANIPEETEWFYFRQQEVWVWVSLALVFFHWMLPFAGTMSLHVRRRPGLMFFWAAYLLVMHFVDVYWMIMPQAREIAADAAPATMGGTAGIAASLLCVVGMSTLLIGLMLRVAGSTKVIPVRDPRIRESIAFENI